jgi:Zn-finger nucleic acid-binding protein
MECPKCRTGEMENVVFEGIEVDRCPSCGGMWFDAGEAETLKQFTNAAEIDIGDGLAGLEYDSIENIDCPRGHGRMATVVNPSLLHVYFERCVVCNGIWFDAGEFADYSKAQVIALFSK